MKNENKDDTKPFLNSTIDANRSAFETRNNSSKA